MYLYVVSTVDVRIYIILGSSFVQIYTWEELHVSLPFLLLRLKRRKLEVKCLYVYIHICMSVCLCLCEVLSLQPAHRLHLHTNCRLISLSLSLSLTQLVHNYFNFSAFPIYCKPRPGQG